MLNKYSKNKMIDIVEIKYAPYLKFYVEKAFKNSKTGKVYIYCENTKTKERVVVGVVEDD